ncbi:L17 family ribosomal protein [Patescibacteria group bacterium]
MRHLKRGIKLKYGKAAEKALLLNLASALILHEKIKTTEKRAKALTPHIEKLINLAKQNKKQVLLRKGLQKNVFLKLTEEISKWYPKRESGYLKRVPLYYQKGDGAKVLQVSFIPHKNVEAKETKEEKQVETKTKKTKAKTGKKK